MREPLLSDGARINRKGQLVLFTGECPRGYCEGEEVGNPLLLPGPNSSAEDLNQVVCGATRKGILCGECSPGFGPGVNLFLAPCVHCATDRLSQVGWLLWLLLEALPLLLMLAVFLVFDINLLACRATELVPAVCPVHCCQLPYQFSWSHCDQQHSEQCHCTLSLCHILWHF